MKQRTHGWVLCEPLETRRLMSADLTRFIDADGQPITATYPSPFYASSFGAKINFQPAGVSTSKLPAGYKADKGQTYATRNGLKYGWASDNTAGMKVRNSSISEDVRYDTFAQFNNSNKWEIAVPKGTYYVRYTVGDPGSSKVSTAEITVEGKFSLKEHLGANNYWLERGIFVNVTDGRLTITTPTTSTQKLDWIEITGQTSKPATPLPMAWKSSSLKAPIGRIESEDVQIGDKLYIMGGFTKDFRSVTNRLDMFNLTTQKWTRLADLPETQTHQAVTTDGRFIYVMGGQVGTRFNDEGWHGTTNSYKYDTKTNKWSSFIAAPALRYQPVCQFVDNKIYIISGGGPNRNDPVPDTFVLDLSDPNPQWVQKKPMPVPQDHASAAVIGSKIYIIGGEHDHGTWHAEHDYTLVYDTIADTWSRLANLPIQSSHFEGSTFVYGGQIFALGGAGDGQVPLWRVSAYNPVTDKWTEYQHSPIGRLGATVGVLGNKLWYIGGDVLTANKHTIDSVSIDTAVLPNLSTSLVQSITSPFNAQEKISFAYPTRSIDLYSPMSFL